MVKAFKKITDWIAHRLFPGTKRHWVLMSVLIVLAVLAAFLIGDQLRTLPNDTLQTTSGEPAGVLQISGVPAEAFKREDTVKVGVSDSFGILNPLFSFADGECDAVLLIFESLIGLDQSANPVAKLAKSWQYDAQAGRLTYQLHQDHTFSDGRQVQVKDVIFTYRCLLSDSYNGPLRGRFSSILDVQAGENPEEVVFLLNDTPQDPDYSLFTVGILPYDHYDINLNRVFELDDPAISPIGSGAFQVVDFKPDRLILQRRPGYGGAIRQIIFSVIASDEKYRLLLEGGLDIVRNTWDVRMKQRAPELCGYALVPFSSRVESYFLVNPAPETGSIIQLSSQRLALLLTAAGRPLSNLQANSLADLAGHPFMLYFFSGLDPTALSQNKTTAEIVAGRLTAAGLDISLAGLDWPDLAKRAARHDYDLMVLPATVNNRLPDRTIILADPVHPSANAWEMMVRDEVFIICNRLDFVTINPIGQPLTHLRSTWTDRIENIRILDHDNMTREAVQP
ncbi:MAG: hypothetical protein GX276_02895 [Clostridiaceae bacterium]|nr:hypothetical protein [Clostridiaceae bacterium]